MTEIRIEESPTVLTDEQTQTLIRAADTLIHPAGPLTRPSELASFRTWVDRAVAGRPDCAAELSRLLDRLACADLDPELPRLAEEEPSVFAMLSNIVAGAYVMHPEVLTAIGYPGQHRNPPRFDEAVEELASGILDAVITRERPVARTVSN